ncbi:MAG: hypothetical protein ABWZ16_10730 [Microbacterium sp.]
MDETAELAALRARAYGPDADIHLDPPALARLAALEGFAHPRSASRTPSNEPKAPAAPRAIASVAATPLGGSVTPATARRRRMVPAWALVAGAAVAGILVGLVAPQVSAPKVVAQLRPTAESDVEFPFELTVIDPTMLVRYDDFDAANVWALDSEDGRECLFVSVSLEWLDATCTPGDLDATVDINVGEGTEFAGFLDLPSGSLVRFVLREDVVEVFVAEGAELQALSP